ncbi:collagen alpha-1(IV) chain-like, partial [Homarus americanus]|uniref:collagen alpha-1(IV) chain-like n=1 Tax=Homarus americanus TaxID=6706 RepID=UPI001C468641
GFPRDNYALREPSQGWWHSQWASQELRHSHGFFRDSSAQGSFQGRCRPSCPTNDGGTPEGPPAGISRDPSLVSAPRCSPRDIIARRALSGTAAPPGALQDSGRNPARALALQGRRWRQEPSRTDAAARLSVGPPVDAVPQGRARTAWAVLGALVSPGLASLRRNPRLPSRDFWRLGALSREARPRALSSARSPRVFPGTTALWRAFPGIVALPVGLPGAAALPWVLPWTAASQGSFRDGAAPRSPTNDGGAPGALPKLAALPGPVRGAAPQVLSQGHRCSQALSGTAAPGALTGRRHHEPARALICPGPTGQWCIQGPSERTAPPRPFRCWIPRGFPGTTLGLWSTVPYGRFQEGGALGALLGVLAPRRSSRDIGLWLSQVNHDPRRSTRDIGAPRSSLGEATKAPLRSARSHPGFSQGQLLSERPSRDRWHSQWASQELRHSHGFSGQQRSQGSFRGRCRQGAQPMMAAPEALPAASRDPSLCKRPQVLSGTLVLPGDLSGTAASPRASQGTSAPPGILPEALSSMAQKCTHGPYKSGALGALQGAAVAGAFQGQAPPGLPNDRSIHGLPGTPLRGCQGTGTPRGSHMDSGASRGPHRDSSPYTGFQGRHEALQVWRSQWLPGLLVPYIGTSQRQTTPGAPRDSDALRPSGIAVSPDAFQGQLPKSPGVGAGIHMGTPRDVVVPTGSLRYSGAPRVLSGAAAFPEAFQETAALSETLPGMVMPPEAPGNAGALRGSSGERFSQGLSQGRRCPCRALGATPLIVRSLDATALGVP